MTSACTIVHAHVCMCSRKGDSARLRTVYPTFARRFAKLNSSHPQWCNIVTTETIHMHAQHCSDVCAFISHSPVVILTSMNIINVQTAARRAINGPSSRSGQESDVWWLPPHVQQVLYDWFSIINGALVLKFYASRVVGPKVPHKWHKKPHFRL